MSELSFLMLASMLIYSVINKSFNWKNNKGLDYLFDLFIAANIILTGSYVFGILLEKQYAFILS
jgi:hypothetical protein